MVKKLMPVAFAFALALALSTPMFTQEGSKPEGTKEKTAKQARYEGVVVRNSKDKSTITVRTMGQSVEKVIHYDSSTRWVSQEHGAKEANDIDPSQVKDGDRVIVQGSEDKKGFHATLISKRLTPLH